MQLNYMCAIWIETIFRKHLYWSFMREKIPNKRLWLCNLKAYLSCCFCSQMNWEDELWPLAPAPNFRAPLLYNITKKYNNMIHMSQTTKNSITGNQSFYNYHQLIFERSCFYVSAPLPSLWTSVLFSVFISQLYTAQVWYWERSSRLWSLLQQSQQVCI